MAKQRQSKSERIDAVLGGDTAAITPDLDARIESVLGTVPELDYQESRDDGGGALGGIKSLGSNLLKALSVPQATLFTGVAKAAGADISWKNALGDFRRTKEGTGIDTALESLGIHNKWAKLGTSLVADPLWFVGGAFIRAPSKAAAAAKLADDAGDAVKVTKAAEGVSAQRSALIRAFSGGAKRAEKPAKGITKKQKRAFGRLAEEAGSRRLDDAIQKVDKAAQEAGTDLGKILDMDEFGRVKNIDVQMRMLREAATTLESRTGLNFGLKFGAGKFSKTLDTRLKASRGLLGRKSSKAFKTGIFAMKPVEKVAHALRRSGAELQEGVPASILRLAETHGLNNEADAAILGTFLQARFVNRDAGVAVKDILQQSGKWTDQHDAVVRAFDERWGELKAPDMVARGTNPAERPHDSELRDLEVRREKAVKKKNRLLASDDSAKVGKSLTKADEEIASIDDQIRLVKERGPYTPTGASRESVKGATEDYRKRVRLGYETPGARFMRDAPAERELGKKETFDNPFNTVTADEFLEDLARAGLDPEDARNLASVVQSVLESKGLPGFLDEAKDALKPEWNAFVLAEGREVKHIWAQVERQIDELLDQAGLGPRTEVGKAVKFGMRTGQAGTLGGTNFGRRAREGVVKLKVLYTTINPAHYVRNAFGDFSNSLINGNWRHIAPGGAAVPKTAIHRLANAEVFAGQGRVDDEILQRIWNIGGKEYTGQELLVMSRMSGLGRGYVGTDIGLMSRVFEQASNKPTEFVRFMQRMNIKRENAQRMQTWIRHMQAGDDPMAAATKTLRVHFDYSQLTDFEKLWMRNLLLFYTWMKRNNVLQATGIATRPGIYNALWNNMERQRTKFPNEPDYFSHQGGIPVPGMDFNLVPGAPSADIHRWDASWGSFRKEVIGAGNPFVRVPTELAFNKTAFTGADIERYEGEKKPSLLGEILGRLGIPGATETTRQAGGEKAFGIDPKLAYLISTITGPQAATAQTVSAPDTEAPAWAVGLGRFLGVSPQIDQPEKFARSKKYAEAKKKADKTRAKNAQS